MQELDEIIAELEEKTRAEIEAAGASGAFEEQNNVSLKKQDYLKLIRNECLAMDFPIPKNLAGRKKKELSELYSELRTKSIKERNFYEIFLTRYELLLGNLIGDDESAEEKLDKFKSMGFYELREKYRNAVSFRKIIKQVNALSADGLDSLIDWLEETAKYQAEHSDYWMDINELSEHIVEGDKKWFESRYGLEELQEAVLIYNNAYEIKFQDEPDFYSLKKLELISIYLEIQEQISEHVDNIPVTPEECKEKAFYVLFLPAYYVAAVKLYEEGPLSPANPEIWQNSKMNPVYVEKTIRLLELLDIELLELMYKDAAGMKSIIRQINQIKGNE